MKYLKKFNESLNIEEIDWNLPAKDISEDVKGEINRIYKKLGINYLCNLNNDNYFSWTKDHNSLVFSDELKDTLFQLKLTENLYDELYEIIINQINDLYDVNCNMKCISTFNDSKLMINHSCYLIIAFDCDDFNNIGGVFNELKDIFKRIKVKYPLITMNSNKFNIKFNIPIDYHF